MLQKVGTGVKIMRLKPRNGPETTQPIGGFKESGAGYSVQDEDGKELGYFGPDQYESIIFEARFDTPSPR
jgi:hypothetical protein